MSVIKLRDDKFDESDGGRVFMSVFAGQDADHLQLSGTLVLRIEEYQEFGCALLLGAERMRGNFTVIAPSEAFKAWGLERAERRLEEK